MQPRAASQPGTHWLPMQRWPRVQWSSTTQATQARVVGSQRGAVTPAPPSTVAPAQASPGAGIPEDGA